MCSWLRFLSDALREFLPNDPQRFRELIFDRLHADPKLTGNLRVRPPFQPAHQEHFAALVGQRCPHNVRDRLFELLQPQRSFRIVARRSGRYGNVGLVPLTHVGPFGSIAEKVSGNMKQVSKNEEIRLQPATMVPHTDERFLDDLMGFVPIAHCREHRAEYDRLILFEQASECQFVGIAYRCHQLFVVFRHHFGVTGHHSRIAQTSPSVNIAGKNIVAPRRRGNWPLGRFFCMRPKTDEELDLILKNALDATRSADPVTHQQWARLRSAIDARATAPTTWWMSPRFALAGVTSLVVIAALVTVLLSPSTDVDKYLTDRGERTRVILSDSSEVTMSHTSELVVKQMRQGETRILTLSGEAFFHVRRNQTPFLVSNGFADVSVLGTEFNVRSRDGVLEVGVLNGSVRVQRIGTNDAAPLILTQGQRALCRQQEDPVRIEDMTSAQYPDWLHDRLELTRTPLIEACREIGSRFGVTVAVRGEGTNEGITGILDATSAESALKSLSTLTGKKLSRDRDAFVLQ